MNVSSVKNLNGETFSAVQDATLTDVVQINSGNWNEISAYELASANYLTAHQNLEDYATTANVDTISSMLSGAIDYVSSNAGGTSLTGDAQGAVDEVYSNSGNWISTINNDASALFFAKKVTNGNYTTWGPILSSNYTTGNTAVKFDILGNSLIFAWDDNYSHDSAYYTLTSIASYGTSNGWNIGNWDWHLDYRGLGGTFSDLNNTTASWSALRNVDLGLTTGGTISSISGHELEIGGGSVTGEFVPLSSMEVAIGDGTNTAISTAFVQGSNNLAKFRSFSQGYLCEATSDSLAQGLYAVASTGSIAQGENVNAQKYSQAFGNGTIATNSGMAIGTFNGYTTAAFVIGNGANTLERSECFYIEHDGNVSAAGDIKASGMSLQTLWDLVAAHSASWS